MSIFLRSLTSSQRFRPQTFFWTIPQEFARPRWFGELGVTPRDLHTVSNQPQVFSFPLTIDQDVDPFFVRFNHILELYSLVSTHVARIRNRARRLTGDSLFGAHVCLYWNNAAWALGWGGRLGCFLEGLESPTGNVYLATILRQSTGSDQSETCPTSSHFRPVSIRIILEA